MVQKVQTQGRTSSCVDLVCGRERRVERREWSVAQLVKNLPAMQETPIRLLVREDPLEKG